MSRTRCSVLHAAPQSRDPRNDVRANRPRIGSASRRKAWRVEDARERADGAAPNPGHDICIAAKPDFPSARPAHRRHSGRAERPGRNTCVMRALSMIIASRLIMVSPATCMVGRSSARVSASFSSDSTGNGKCSREAISVWYSLLWVDSPNTCSGAGGLQLREQVAERAGLRRAAPRAGNHVPVVDQADLAGLAGPRIGEHHGAPGQRRQHHRGIVGGNQVERRDRHADEMRRRAIVGRRRNFAPVNVEQILLVHRFFLSIDRHGERGAQSRRLEP